MLDFIKIKNGLQDSFNRDKSKGVDICINVNVINEENGKFSINVSNEELMITSEHEPKADITVGFINKDTMLEMFTKGANPTSLVMTGKMTFNGDMAKGRSIKGLFEK